MTAISSEGSFDRYKRSVSALQPLTPQQEACLGRAWRSGDRTAGDRLVQANLGCVLGIAREYRRWGVPMDDLVQQGAIGLLKAAAKYDPERDNTLRAYASYWIRAEIREYVVRNYRIVRLGSTRTERRAVRAYRARAIESVEDLVQHSGMPEARCKMLWPVLAQKDFALDAPHGAARTGLELLPTAIRSPEELAANREEEDQRRAEVADALASLSDREQQIVRARMMSDEPQTLEQLGKQMGVSRERVRQLESRAKQKIRAQLTAA